MQATKFSLEAFSSLPLQIIEILFFGFFFCMKNGGMINLYDFENLDFKKTLDRSRER